MAVAALLIYGLPLAWQLRMYLSNGVSLDLYDTDFANYWVGGRLTLSRDHLTLFNHDRYFAHLQELFGADYQLHSWSYPPHFLLLIWPLGLFSYASALVGFLAVTLVLFAASSAVAWKTFAPDTPSRQLVIAMVSYTAMMLSATQNGFLFSSLALLALAWMRTKPVLAGLALALLTIKPQLGILIPVVAVFDRNWAAIKWACIFTAVLIVTSIACFGLTSWIDYFGNVIPYQRFVMTNWQGIFLRMMPGTFGSLRSLGFTPALSMYVQAAVSAISLVYLVWLFTRLQDPLQKSFAVLCATFIASPYAFNYDMGALSVVAALLAMKLNSQRMPAAALTIGLVAVVPGLVTNLGRALLPVTPVLLGAALLCIAPCGAVNPARGRQHHTDDN
jgi:arabinofuranan 3-O-arabinosyltransferase